MGLKFAEEDLADSELAVKTLRNNSAVKLRNRSLSLGQKVRRVSRGSQRRRLLSQGRAVRFIRLKRSLSTPSATSTMVLSPTADCTTQALQTPDRFSLLLAGEPKKMRAGVFERSWTDTLADNAVTTSSTLEECSKSVPVAEDESSVTDSVPVLTDNPVISASTNETVFTADVEDLGNKTDLSSLVSDVSCLFFGHFIHCMLCSCVQMASHLGQVFPSTSLRELASPLR